MSLSKQLKTCFAGFALTVVAATANAEVVAVVSPRSTVTSLSSSQVADIFLGRVNRFPNGEPAVPIDQMEGTTDRDEFYMRFAHKSPSQIKAHWSKIIFTGKGEPPKEVTPIEKIKRLIAANPNFIGYIDRSALDANVKMITVTSAYPD